MRSNNRLILLRIIQTNRIAQIADIKRRDMIAISEGEVSKFAVVGDVGVDGDIVLSLWTEVDKKLGHTLLAGGVCAEGVDDPDFAGCDGGRESGGLRVPWDELDVLDAATVGYSVAQSSAGITLYILW